MHCSITKIIITYTWQGNNETHSSERLRLFRLPDRQGGHHGFFYNGVQQPGFENFHSRLGLHQWTSYCHVMDAGQYVGYVGGEERARGPITSGDIPLRLDSTLVLGQEQDLVSEGFDVRQVFRGHLAQVNIWNRSLGPDEVARQAACGEAVPLGNVFSSDRDDVEMFGATLETVEAAALCQSTEGFVVFPVLQHLEEAQHTCRRMGQQLYSPGTLEDNVVLYNASLQFTDTCTSNYHLWIGATDRGEEEVWRKFSDDTEIKPPFALGEPNGGANENCLLMFLGNGRWIDTLCDLHWLACAPCQSSNDTPLRLRGLCFEWEAQTFFEVLGYRAKKPYFHGYYGLMIYSRGSGAWHMLDTTTGRQMATLSLTSEDLYPIGRHTWTLSAGLCHRPPNTTVTLSLSVCDRFQFTCSSGDCVPKVFRCNGRDDCPDLSDEQDCSTVVVPDGYQRERPPSDRAAGQPLFLGVIVKIHRIMDISDVRRHVMMELEADMTWTDNQLKFRNLKDNLEFNRVSSRDSELLWTPRLLFPNAPSGDLKLVDKQAFISKTGPPEHDDFDDVRTGECLSVLLFVLPDADKPTNQQC